LQAQHGGAGWIAEGDVAERTGPELVVLRPFAAGAAPRALLDDALQRCAAPSRDTASPSSAARWPLSRA
jgi:hypothetical protein